MGFTSASAAVVQLVSPSKGPRRPIDILGVAEPDRREDDPRIAWIGPEELLVTLRTADGLHVLHRSWHSIKIDIAFDSTDPVKRAQFDKALHAGD